MPPIKQTLRRAYNLMPREPSTNYRCRNFDVNPYAMLPRDAMILDIASKNSRATYGFGAPPADARVVCVDIEPGDGVDLIADAHQLPLISSESVDCVICVSFLYAAKYPSLVINEIHRVLKPGGIFYISVPYVFPRCADPGDYYRFSASGLEVLCEKFERLDGGFNRGPASTMLELGVRFYAMLFCFNNPYLYYGWRYALKWPFFWVKYLDKFMGRYRMAFDICSGSYFIGRKNGVSNDVPQHAFVPAEQLQF
jgi:SAM-dependent methyltransferase